MEKKLQENEKNTIEIEEELHQKYLGIECELRIKYNKKYSELKLLCPKPDLFLLSGLKY